MTTTHPLLKNPFSHNVFDWIALKMLGEESYHACIHRSSEYFYHKGIFRKISLILLFGLQFVMIAYMILSCHNMNVSSIVCVMLDQITHFAQFINTPQEKFIITHFTHPFKIANLVQCSIKQSISGMLCLSYQEIPTQT